jgi:SAM-dependent methyltransferase
MTRSQSRREWAPFERDAVENDGYVYTTNPPLSSRIASLRHSKAIHGAVDFHGKRVIDIGCGDGTYSVELYDRGRPRSIFALDPAASALEIARRKAAGREITFEAASAYEIPCGDGSFDIAHLRGVLHHMDRPFDALREAFRVAPSIIVLEPNGYNLGLKLIEKVSRYHRLHGEKSYSPARLDRWARRLGAKVIHRDWACLVPYFSPDWLARAVKVLEPIVESIPVLDRLGCSTYVMVAERGT